MATAKVGHLAALLSLMQAGSLAHRDNREWAGLPYTWLYQYPLPIPSVKEPKMWINSNVTGELIDYYEVSIQSLQQQIYPNNQPTHLIGYDGLAVGETFIIERDRETVVRITNNSPNVAATHLHGSPTRAPWDGWAKDIIETGQYKDYYYGNHQSARTFWYHDHAEGQTAVNVYFGQAGMYIIHDPDEDALGLPDIYGSNDIPIIITSKQYNQDASLDSPADERESLWGDIIQVNGQPWPFFNVEPRKYRLRLLNAAVSRTFALYFSDDQSSSNKIPFQVIASDSGLLSSPATSDQVALSMAERWDVVIDFSIFKGHNITLRNDELMGDGEAYKYTDQVMRFVVSEQSVADNTTVPEQLRDIPALPDHSQIDQQFAFFRQNEWVINGVVFSDVAHRVLARPPRGTIEVWELANHGIDATHPVHVHLVDFKILSRQGGRRGVQNYEALGLKDTVWLDRGEVVTVEAQYGPWDGLYMFHCHNLVHEDHEMMAVFNVTVLADLGYNETSFEDPMEPRWRAKTVRAEDYTPDAVEAKVQFMASLKPYSNIDESTR